MVARIAGDECSMSTLESTGQAAARIQLKDSTTKAAAPALDVDNKLTTSICRHVRFQEQVQIRLISLVWEEFDEDEIRSMWYSQDEFDEFKKLGRMLAKEIRLRGQSKVMEHAYRWAQTLAFSLVDGGPLEAFLNHGGGDPDLFKKHVQDFCAWAQRGTGRGLEHWTSKAHFTARIDIKQQVRYVVVDLWGLGEACEAIGQASQEHSRSSRILARFLGLADSQFKVPPCKQQALEREIMNAYHRQQREQQRTGYWMARQRKAEILYDDSFSDKDDEEVEEQHNQKAEEYIQELHGANRSSA